MDISSLVPADGTYEDRLAQIAAEAAPPLDAIQVERLRGLLGPALRKRAADLSVVALPVADETKRPGRAAA